jgi:hypothetical protein
MYTVRCEKEIIRISRDLTERLIIGQLVKKSLAFYGTRRFIAVVTRAATGVCPEIMDVVCASELYNSPIT